MFPLQPEVTRQNVAAHLDSVRAQRGAHRLATALRAQRKAERAVARAEALHELVAAR